MLRHLAPALALGLALLAAPGRAAPVADTIAQRVQACTGCHGPQGRAGSDGYYPRLAGKPAEYLYHQLVAFRDGRRRYAPMTNLLEPLSDAYLHEIAAYFSSLEVPYPPPQPATTSVDALTRGQALALRGDAKAGVPACVRCHGAALAGVAPAVPALIGLPRDYLVAQLGAWRTGARHALAPDCMGQVAQRLAPGDLSALAHWLAAQPVPRDAAPAPGLPKPLPMACGGVSAATVDVAAGSAPGDEDDDAAPEAEASKASPKPRSTTAPAATAASSPSSPSLPSPTPSAPSRSRAASHVLPNLLPNLAPHSPPHPAPGSGAAATRRAAGGAGR